MYAVAARAPCIPSIPCPPTLFQLFVHFYRWLSFARYVARANGFLVAEMRSSTPRRDSQVLNFERCFPTRSNGSSNVTRIQHAIAWLGFSGFNRKIPCCLLRWRWSVSYSLVPSTKLTARLASRRSRGVDRQCELRHASFSSFRGQKRFLEFPFFCFLDGIRGLSFTPRPSLTGCHLLGAVWTQLPFGAGWVRTAALVLHASSCEAPLHFQSNLSSLMGFAGERESLVRQSTVRPCPGNEMFDLELPSKVRTIFFNLFSPCSFWWPYFPSGVRSRDMWLVCFSPVRPSACFVGVASCRVYGGRHAQQQILPREVRLRSKVLEEVRCLPRVHDDLYLQRQTPVNAGDQSCIL